MSVGDLVGKSFKTAVFHVAIPGFVIVFASLSQPYILIVDGNSNLWTAELMVSP